MSTRQVPAVLSMNSLVAHNLAAARALRGLTQEQLGHRLTQMTGRPWSKATISALERSADGVRIRQFDADDLVLLAQALDVSVIFFLLPLPREYHPRTRYVHRPTTEGERPSRDALDAAEVMGIVMGTGDHAADTIGTGEATAAVRYTTAELLGAGATELLADLDVEQLARWRDVLDEVVTELTRTVAGRSGGKGRRKAVR